MAEEKRSSVRQYNRVVIEQLCFLDNLVENLIPESNILDKREHAKAIVLQMKELRRAIKFDYNVSDAAEHDAMQWVYEYIKLFDLRYRILKFIFQQAHSGLTFKIPAPPVPSEYPAGDDKIMKDVNVSET